MSTGRGFRFNEGDWTCPECSNVNFARRSQCNRCGVDRKYEVKKIKKGGIEIGKMAAEKSKGLFSADDWMCKTCGNVNWARRGDCNMCNTPKVNVQEERTGLGGGFNERDGVEYKEKEDSDSEFDEFGRRKKKFRAKPPVAEVKPVTTTEDDDEEEEESGSDEDVSKYDLDAEDEEDDDEDTGKYDLAGSSDEERDRKPSRSSSGSPSRSRVSRNKGRSSSRSRSRSRSRGRRSRSSSSDSSGGRRRKNHHHGHEKKKPRSRSRSPHHRHRRR